MNNAFLIHTIVTWALVGLIWTVQVFQYPLLRAVPREGFVGYHGEYMRRITSVVGPLMLAEAGSAIGLLYLGMSSGWFYASIGLIGLIWLSTWLVQVPLHGRLTQGFDDAAHRRLVATNWVRTALWTARACLLLGVTW